MTNRLVARAVLPLLLSGLCLNAMAQPASAAASASIEKGVVKTIKWEDLVPKGWDPYAGMQEKNLGMLIDGSARTLQAMRDLRAVWDNAPTNAAIEGQAVKLPGYVVPLEETKKGMKEFLLVPYFGACIHTPPPPANQIVHVFVDKPVKGYSAMDTVWVSGKLTSFRQDSEMGVSGYRMEATRVDRYVVTPR